MALRNHNALSQSSPMALRHHNHARELALPRATHPSQLSPNYNSLHVHSISTTSTTLKRHHSPQHSLCIPSIILSAPAPVYCSVLDGHVC